jgi:hypothetical protein
MKNRHEDTKFMKKNDHSLRDPKNLPLRVLRAFVVNFRANGIS